MSLSYPLADSITRIRNGQSVRLANVRVVFSNLIFSVLSVMHSEGYINSIKKLDLRKGVSVLDVGIKYYSGRPVIEDIKVISKPGRRVYVSSKKIGSFYDGLGILIMSTSKGIVSSEKSSKLGLGGEVLCAVF